MSESSAFIKEEKLTSGSGLLALNWRLFSSLPLFMKVFPLSLLAIVASSAVPSVFRWYSGELSNGRPGFRLGALLAIVALGVLFRIAAWALFEISGMWASQGIHARMVRGMSLTRTTFYDENPSGRLINRLIRDYDEVRSTAIIFVGDFLNASVEVLSIAVVASFASPWALALLVPLLAMFLYVQFQRSGMLEHARSLSAVATSQVLGRKTDLIEGREIFLLYGRAELLLERMAQSFRAYVQSAALMGYIDTWGSFWIRISAEAFSFTVLVLMAFAIAHHRIDAALAGVIISSLFGITGSIGWLDVATGLISRSAPHVRRVFEFVDLPPEEAEEGRATSATVAGPVRGDIVFDRYSMSYRKDTPVILEDLTLRIAWGSKTALVGRTGSGKTSVTQALLRMVHVRGGEIRIGESSIFDMDVRALRRLFGVVPQFPYLFAGTVRSNLDRVGAIPEERLRSSLEAVGLKYALDHPLVEGGQNLSLGERQLVCLARVIAAERPIILMDEPTSGLDPQTDARINLILKTAFRDRTVITIAHRRESLGSYDRIVELKDGRVLN